MEKLIRNFYIECAGDPSVGIFPSKWELIGDTYFEPDDLEGFRSKLAKLFEEYITGEPTKVTTFEERVNEFNEDDKQHQQNLKDISDGKVF